MTLNTTPYRPDDDVLEAVESLLDLILVRHYDAISEEPVRECRLCGDWEGHTQRCPIPSLKTFYDNIP